MKAIRADWIWKKLRLIAMPWHGDLIPLERPEIVLAYERSPPPGFFSSDFFSRNLPQLTQYLPMFYGTPNIKMLEIGAFEGRSTLWFVKNFCNGPRSSLDVIDAFVGIRDQTYPRYQEKLAERFMHNLRSYLNQKAITLHRGYSKDVLMNFTIGSSERKLTYDIIYIDGEHHAKSVMEDIILSWELLKVGGIMILDDYGWFSFKRRFPSVKLAVDLFLESYAPYLEVLVHDYQVHVRKNAK